MKKITLIMLILAQLSGLIYANEQSSYPQSYESNLDLFQTNLDPDESVQKETASHYELKNYFPKHIKYLLLIIITIGALSIVWLFFRVGEIAEAQHNSNMRIDQLNTISKNVVSRNLSEKPTSNLIHKPTKKQIPKIEFAQGVIEKMTEGINYFSSQHTNIETGYALVGNVVGLGSRRKLVVVGLVGAGPGIQKSALHVEFNGQYQQTEIKKMQLIDHNVCHIGDCHLHPGSMDRCSDGDYKTDRENVINSHTQEMVFVIATKKRAHRQKNPDDAIYFNGLKLDFFYMGKGSNYEYQRFLPVIVPGEAILVDSSLSDYYDSDPTKVTLDFDNLHRLSNYSYQLLNYSLDGENTSPCVELTHKKEKFKLFILFGDSTAEKPTVYIEYGNEWVEYTSDYLKNNQGDNIWFTQIALSAEQEVPMGIKQKPKHSKSINV